MQSLLSLPLGELAARARDVRVKLGVAGAQRLLMAGVDDLGGTLMDENISRAAGAAHGQALDEDDFQAITRPLGRRLVERSTLYDVAAAGSR